MHRELCAHRTMSISAAIGLLLLPLAIVHTASAQHRPRLTPHIVNGVLTQQYPTVGALLVADDPFNPDAVSNSCTVTLIGCETVLTAAHCVCPTDTEAGPACLAAGVADPSTLLVFLQHAGIFPVSSVTINPAYEFGVASDVAVIKLATPVSGIVPARLNAQGSPTTGTAGTIVGFGISTDNGEDSGLKRAGAVVTAPCGDGISNSTHVCWNFLQPVGPAGQDSNTCQGDSGGPLFIDFGAGDRLAGVTSGGAPGCGADSTSWDADAFVERFWIQTEAGADLNTMSCGNLPPVGSAGTQVDAKTGELSASSPDTQFTVTVPAGAALLRVTLNGEDGEPPPSPGVPNDFDLYVKAGRAPTLEDFDCRDIRIGPYGACQFTSPAAGTWHVRVIRVDGGGTFQITATIFGVAAPICVGDCNANRTVTVDELVTGVNIALGSLRPDHCSSFDANGDGTVTVDELIRGVNNALSGCALG